jgi:hypothetical protein
MTHDMIRLATDRIEVVVDPGRGADILALVHRASGLDVLFRTPWRDHADVVRAGAEPRTHDPVAGWLERYRGGWQVNCPNAGPPRSVHGAPVGFHGEASRASWQVLEVAPTAARMAVELFSVPVRIDRQVDLDDATVRVTDTLTNLSDVPLEIDYVAHPAFGGEFLRAGVDIELDGGHFISDPDSTSTVLEPGSRHRWPGTIDRFGAPLDLSQVPPAGTRREVFGWLEALPTSTVTLRSRATRLDARIDWDGERLPYAWLWQELESTPGFPWYRRARALAVEPASTPTSGPDRPSLALDARATVALPVSITLKERNLP